MLKRILIVQVFLCGFVFSAHTQVAENVSASFRNGKAVITYDLTGLRAKEIYIVTLYASYNEFRMPLRQVSGDVGKNTIEGKNRKIEWDGAEAGTLFNEKITFRIHAALLFSPLEFINPTGGSVRRGTTTIIEWVGGYLSAEKELELYRGDQRVATFGTMKDVWTYKWDIPKDLARGKDYTLRLTGKNEKLVSNAFAIKRRTPLLLKLSPLIIAAAVIPFLNKGEVSKTNTLPGAPAPE